MAVVTLTSTVNVNLASVDVSIPGIPSVSFPNTPYFKISPWISGVFSPSGILYNVAVDDNGVLLELAGLASDATNATELVTNMSPATWVLPSGPSILVDCSFIPHNGATVSSVKVLPSAVQTLAGGPGSSLGMHLLALAATILKRDPSAVGSVLNVFPDAPPMVTNQNPAQGSHGEWRPA